MEELLDRQELSDEEIKGILAIVNAIIDEGPVPGISTIDNPVAMLDKVLAHASRHLPLEPWYSEAVNNISNWLEENGNASFRNNIF